MNNYEINERTDNEYLSPYEQEALETIPKEAFLTIKKYGYYNRDTKKQLPFLGELVVDVPIFASNAENETLLYALTQGTAYKIVDNIIYIWYSPAKGFYGSGFFKLKRFCFLNNGSYIKYILDSRYKLEM